MTPPRIDDVAEMQQEVGPVVGDCRPGLRHPPEPANTRGRRGRGPRVNALHGAVPPHRRLAKSFQPKMTVGPFSAQIDWKRDIRVIYRAERAFSRDEGVDL